VSALAHATTLAGLVPLSPQPLPFDRTLHIRAFLLRRAAGNLLVYSTAALEQDLPAIRSMGGAARQCLNHRHEAMFLPAGIDAPLVVHERERASVERSARVDSTFGVGDVLDGDFELIPTPGHTPGATAFLWDSGSHRMLFTGDTIYLRGGEWVAAVLASSDRDAYVQSLERLRELDFDVLVPWAATKGQPYLAQTDRDDARRRIGWIIDRVRDGGSS